MHDIKDYFAGGKKLGFLAVSFSARATGESAWLLLALTGMGFALGVQAFWVVVGELVGVAGAWLFMARRFKRLTDQYDSITVPDYLESRLRDKTHGLRLIAAGALLIFVPIYAGAQVFASGGAFYNFLGWNHYLGAAFGFGIVLIYITQGGFTAVVWSDVFQGSLMVIGLVLLPIVGLMEIGGITHLVDALRSIDPDLLSWHGPGQAAEITKVVIPSSGAWNTSAVFTIVGLVAIGVGFWGSPQIFVRYISMKSEKSILPGTITAVIWTVLADSGAVLVGIFGRALLDSNILPANNETVLPVMADTYLVPFISGMFIAMVLSAIMSTIDSLLVLASSAAVRDYWQKTKHPDMSDEQLMSTSRKLTLVLAIIAFAVGMTLLLINKDKQIFWVVIFGWSGIAATFCPTMILSLYWSKLTAKGAKYAMVAGFLGVPIFSFAVGPLLKSMGMSDIAGYLAALDVLLPSFLIGFTVAIVVSLLDKDGQANLVGVNEDLNFAKTGKN
jgi:sodium/proline symporter